MVLVSKKQFECDASIERAMNNLERVENILADLERKQCEEELQIADKYFALKLDHYNERNSIAKEIPQFWSRVFSNHPILCSLLEANDMEAFSYLTSLNIEKPSRGHVKIIFEFSENPFFTNKQLIKEFVATEDEKVSIIRYSIDWKAGNNLLEADTPQKKSGRRSNKRRVETSSFFSWFVDDDYQLGEIIAEDLYPKAVKLFKGEISEDEDEIENDLFLDEEASDKQ